MLSYVRASPGQRDEAEERPVNLQEALATETTGLTDGYCALCTSLQVAPHSGVLAFIRLRLAELRPLEREGFADRDMFAFCDFMLRESASAKAILEHPHPHAHAHPHPHAHAHPIPYLEPGARKGLLSLVSVDKDTADEDKVWH